MDLIEHVRAAGQRRNGLPAEAATRFAVLAAAALMVASLRDPLHRPLGRVGALLVGALALLAYLLTARAVVTLVATALALVVVPLLFFTTLAMGERWAAPRSDRVWLGRSSTGWAAARVMVKDGKWMLGAVSGWPLGKHNGPVLMNHICAQADADSSPIRLTADVDRLIGWYARWGFRVEQRRLGQAVMERRADSASSLRAAEPADLGDPAI